MDWDSVVVCGGWPLKLQRFLWSNQSAKGRATVASEVRQAVMILTQRQPVAVVENNSTSAGVGVLLPAGDLDN